MRGDILEFALGGLSLTTTALSFLAQADPMPPLLGPYAAIMSLVQQFGGLGLAIWLVIHHTLVVTPRMQKEFREERQILVDHHNELTTRLNEEHLRAMAAKREDFLTVLNNSFCKYKQD